MGTIVSLNISRAKGTPKTPVDTVTVRPEHGVEGDAHAADWHRQVSLLAEESIRRMAEAGLDVGPGSFAENITTAGIDLPRLPVGTRLRSGGVVLEITQIGKECHTRCAIYHKAGDCIMPKEGVFAKVLVAGTLQKGAAIAVEGS